NISAARLQQTPSFRVPKHKPSIFLSSTKPLRSTIKIGIKNPINLTHAQIIAEFGPPSPLRN
ncbi:MAG: hypothetical protein V3W45_06230, partial [Sedimentisphaerales bacterium]